MMRRYGQKPGVWRAWLVLAGYALIVGLTQCRPTVAGGGLDMVLAGARQRGAVRVAVDFGVLPFTGLRDGMPYGYDIELAQAIAGQLGLTAEFVASGPDSIYDDLAARRADMALSALPYAPELSWRTRYSQPYLDLGLTLLVRRDATWRGFASSDSQRVGVVLGSDGDTYLRRPALVAPALVRVTYDDAATASAALADGLLDAVLVDRISAVAAAARDPRLDIGASVTEDLVAVAFAPDATQLAAEVDRALGQLRRAGAFAALEARWFRDE
jgi:ABC-type amino acid transport substrate-binding protein